MGSEAQKKAATKSRPGFPVVVTAPSGTGKTSICRRVAKDMKRVSYSVSLTTRERRKGERNGRDYIFVTEKRFKQLAAAGKLAEWASIYGSYYGTPQSWLDSKLKRGQCVLLALDHNGGEMIREKYRGSVLIYLLPPSIEELKRRLRGRRTDSESSIKMRLESARKELAFAGKYDYWVVNSRLDQTADVLRSIIVAEEHKRARLDRIKLT
jgi:guanylate kinase